VQPLSSAISGQVALVAQRQSSAGTEPGRTGSARSQIVSAETAREWLLRQPHPEEADAALARSLTSTLGVTALLRTEHRFPPNGPAYRVTVGCDLAVQDEAAIPDAIAKIEQAMTPATAEQCEGWLVMMQAAMAHRSDSDATSAVAYGLYAAELRRYPADVAKAVCERFTRGKLGNSGTNWFPTLAELIKELERFTAPRQAMLRSLHKYAPGSPSLLGAPLPAKRETEEAREQRRRATAETLRKLADTAERQRPAHRDLSATHGKTDETGLTPEMRALMARRAAE
jgi:hypothetical protein